MAGVVRMRALDGRVYNKSVSRAGQRAFVLSRESSAGCCDAGQACPNLGCARQNY